MTCEWRPAQPQNRVRARLGPNRRNSTHEPPANLLRPGFCGMLRVTPYRPGHNLKSRPGCLRTFCVEGGIGCGPASKSRRPSWGETCKQDLDAVGGSGCWIRNCDRIKGWGRASYPAGRGRKTGVARLKDLSFSEGTRRGLGMVVGGKDEVKTLEPYWRRRGLGARAVLEDSRCRLGALNRRPGTVLCNWGVQNSVHLHHEGRRQN